MLARQHLSTLQIMVDGFGHRHVGHAGVGGGHVRDQVRWGVRHMIGRVDRPFGRRGVAGLADVQLVAGPGQVPFAAPAGVGVIRRDDPASARRESISVGLPQSDHLPPTTVDRDYHVLDQDLLQDPDAGQGL